MNPNSTPGMKVSTLSIVLEGEKSGPGMAARRAQASWRAKAVLMMRISKALVRVLELILDLLIWRKDCWRDSHLKATKVKMKRSNNHLSVGGIARDFLPKDVASETSVVFETSILRKLARWETYLTRMAMMQMLPTAQQQSTGTSSR